MLQKIKQAWTRFLARLTAQNQASFGSEPLDCCRVGRENKQNRPRS